MKALFKDNKGFGLLSFSITCLLSAILLTAAVQCILLTQKTLKQFTDDSTMRENTMLAGTILRQAIDSAGLSTCSTLNTYLHIDLDRRQHPYATLPIDKHAIMIYHPENRSSLALSLGKKGAGQWLQSSNILKIERITDTLLPSETLHQGANSIIIASRPPWKKNNLIVMDNCQNMAIFSIKRMQRLRGAGSKITLDHPSAFTFKQNSALSRLDLSLYYIGNTAHKDEAGKYQHAFYIKTINGTRHELISDIANLSIRPVFTESTKENKIPYTLLDVHLSSTKNRYHWHFIDMANEY